jgi:hypothetical protein
MMQVGSVAAPRGARAPVARADAAFPWYIAAALGVAVGGGFALALLAPLAVALGWDWGMRWRPLVQAHGHLQVGGWIGLFIVGIGYRLVPRFAGRPLFLSGATAPTLALLLWLPRNPGWIYPARRCLPYRWFAPWPRQPGASRRRHC